MIVREPSEGRVPAVGETITLSTEAERLHVFDASSGLRIGDG